MGEDGFSELTKKEGEIKTRVGIGMCIYNEKQFIEKVLLNNTKKLRGVDFIYILDGSWPWIGGEAQSNDGTKEIVEKTGALIKERWGIDVKFGQIEKLFRSQGEKRNFGLKRAEEIMKEIDPDAHWYHLIIDGDEFIEFTSGLTEIWLDKPGASLDQIWPKMGLLAAYAVGSPKKLLTPRFIPAFQGYHYHTDQRMVIHDKNCVSVVDYNPRSRSYAKKLTTEITQFFLLNKWNARDIDRSMIKMTYNSLTYPNQSAECRYKLKTMDQFAELNGIPSS